MRYLKILGIVIVVIVVLITGAVIAISFVDINEYKGVIAEQVKQATGRDLSIEGNLDLKVSLIPTVSAQDIRFANSTWGSQVDMITVHEAEMQLALLSLLSGEIQLHKLNLKAPNILLETNEEGQSNWEFHAKAPDETPQPDEQEDGAGMALRIVQVRIENGHFVYRDGVSGKTTEVNLDELVVRRKDSRVQDLKLQLSYNGIPVMLEGSTGLIDDLLQNDPFMVQLAARVGDVKIAVDGKVTQPLDVKGVDLKAVVKSPTLETIAKLAGTELPPVGPIDLNAAISEDGKLYLVKLNGGANDIELDVDGKLAQTLDGKGLNANFSIQAPDLKTALKLADPELPAVGPISLKGNISEAGEFYKAKLNGMADEITLTIDGQVAQALDGKGIQFDLALEAPDLKMLGELGGTELPSAGPVNVKGRISDIKSGVKVSKLNAKVGFSDLSGNATVTYEDTPISVLAQLNSKHLDLSAFEKQNGASGKGPAKQPTKKQSEKTDHRLFPADPLPFDQLKTTNAKIKFNADKIHIRNQDLQNVRVDLTLKNGKLDIEPLQAVTTTGSIEGDVSLDASTARPRFAFNLKVSDLELGKLKPLEGVVRGGKTTTSISLSGSGTSVREIMAGLNGQTVVDVGKGQVVNEKLNLVGAVLLSEIVAKVNPRARKGETSSLDCVVIRFDVKDGMATTDQGIAVETDKITMVGSGAINLKNETLDFGIRSDARKRHGVGAGELTQVVRLRGTLAKPKLAADAKGVATVGATVGAAIATGGLSYLAQKAYGAATKDSTPCRTALGKVPASSAQKKSGKSDRSSKESAPSERVKKWFDDAKGLFKD